MIVLIFLACVLAAFALGVLVGPHIHDIIKICQDDHGFSNTDTVVKTDLKYDPLAAPGDYWDPASKKPSKRKSKGKRKEK